MPRLHCDPKEGTQAFQSFHYRPADPAWAPASLLERARETLKDYYSGLDLWWSPMRGYGKFAPGRWRIVQWMPNLGNWGTVCYWEAADGSYREPSPEALRRRVEELDMWAKGDDLQKMSDRIDEQNTGADEKEHRAKVDDVWNQAHSDAKLQSGIRKHFDQKPRLILP